MTLTKKEVKALRELVRGCNIIVEDLLTSQAGFHDPWDVMKNLPLAAKALKMKLPGRGE